MVAIVAFASQKGGVGKSTLARALACEVAQDELRVRLADLDTMQHTTADWHTARLQAGLEPVGDVQVFATVQQALKNAESYDLIIIDAPARVPAGTLEIARLATILVQPTNTCEDDRRPAVREFHGLVKHGVPKERLVFAINHVLSEATEKATRAYFAEAGYDSLTGSIPEKPAYRQAHDTGRAITEAPYPTLKARADVLIQSLIDRVANYG
jgi:chromosome partitioning protein